MMSRGDTGTYLPPVSPEAKEGDFVRYLPAIAGLLRAL